TANRRRRLLRIVDARLAARDERRIGWPLPLPEDQRLSADRDLDPLLSLLGVFGPARWRDGEPDIHLAEPVLVARSVVLHALDRAHLAGERVDAAVLDLSRVDELPVDDFVLARPLRAHERERERECIRELDAVPGRARVRLDLRGRREAKIG